jgi:predicted DNA-binding transcriptional regulator AlpA
VRTKKARSRLASARARHDSVAPDLNQPGKTGRSGVWRRPAGERDDPSAPALTPVNYPRPPPLAGGSLLLSKAEVCTAVGKSYQHLWTLMRRNEFPRSRLVGTRPMWLRNEIEAWIASLPVVRLKGDAPDAS